MTIPTEHVGSLPRPSYVHQALADYDAGKITKEELVKIQTKAAEDSIKRMEETGQELVGDGDQFLSAFCTYPLIDTLMGTGMAENLSGENMNLMVIFDDGHERHFPRLVGKFKYKQYAYESVERSKQFATHPMKEEVISPTMMYFLYPMEKELDGYPRREFVQDVLNECEKDIRGCFAAGVKRVSIDFTEGRIAVKNDPRTPWTTLNLLDELINLNNLLLSRFSAEERVNIGIHVCAGGDCDSLHSGGVDYLKLLPQLFKINAGYFLLECTTEPDIPATYKTIGESIRKDADGVKQVAFIGVTCPTNPRIETPEEISESIATAAKYIPADQLGVTDDCGFGPFSTDVKPKHGGPDAARDVAFQKIANRVKGVKMASEKLGI